MNFKFHHMNLCTDNLPRLTKFYKTLFELGTISDKEHTVVSGVREDRAYTGKVDFLTDGDIEFHWAERDLDTGFKMKQFVNPMGHGHSVRTTSRASCASAMRWASAIRTTGAGPFPAGTKSFCTTPMAM
jgi:hypothetical protein